MTPPAAKESECTKDQVPGYTVRGDHQAVPPRHLLDQYLNMLCTAQAGDEFGIRHRPVDCGVTPNITKPSTREDRHTLRQPEPPGDIPAGTGKPDLLLDSPALIDPDRGQEEEMAVRRLQEGDPLQAVDARSPLEGLQGGGCGKRPPDRGIDPAGVESLDDGGLRLPASMTVTSSPNESAVPGGANKTRLTSPLTALAAERIFASAFAAPSPIFIGIPPRLQRSA